MVSVRPEARLCDGGVLEGAASEVGAVRGAGQGEAPPQPAGVLHHVQGDAAQHGSSGLYPS